ncbi:trypsin-1-like [Planococcus citri]|uniref:trypsin-1-like n=1 Tax=Planococcus citri TaxID=170843 RepID=UPI0031F97058
MFLASVIVFLNIVMIQLPLMPTAEGVFINKRFPMTDILYRPQRSTGTDVSMCPECDCRTFTRKKRVVGGIEAEQNKFPWMAALKLTYGDTSTFCGATVITKQHLLTAAHCVEGVTADEIQASLGGFNQLTHEYDINEITVGIEEIIRHPGFNLSSLDNDIAILKLDSTISFNTSQIQPACLPSTENEDYAGYYGTVIGWGFTDESQSVSNKMQKVEVPIIWTNHCRINYSILSYSVTDNMMCAGNYFGHQGICTGDSGGPLQINIDGLGTMKVVGIVSWSHGCARPYYPGVYTRIDRYKRWIRDNTGGECLCEI